MGNCALTRLHSCPFVKVWLVFDNPVVGAGHLRPSRHLIAFELVVLQVGELVRVNCGHGRGEQKW